MPSTTDYLPTREAELLQWSATLDAAITSNPTNYGLVAAQATAYNVLHQAFADAWNLANNNATRTPAVITTKNDAKQALIGGSGGIRDLVAIIQSFPGTTDTERRALGLSVRDTEPTPVPPPTTGPQLVVAGVSGRTVTLRLRDPENPDSRKRPEGAAAATVLSFVGAEPPEDLNQWSFRGNTSLTTVDVEFPSTVEAGATVWLTAFWFNRRSQSSPATNPPVSATIQYGLSLAA